MSHNIPLISAIMLTYNSDKYIESALNGLLKQTYGNLEIIISDDHSTDDTWNKIKSFISLNESNHSVVKYQQPKNLGLTAHLNKLIKKSKGDFIVLFAGDDNHYSDRVTLLYQKWLETDCSDCSIFTNAVVIDENGVESGLYYKNPDITSLNSLKENGNFWIGGFSHGFSRNLFEKYGELPSGTFQEDAIFAFRALLNGGIFFIDEPTVQYRIHDSNSYKPTVLTKLLKLEKSEKKVLENALIDLDKYNSLTLDDYQKIKLKIKLRLWKKIILSSNAWFVKVKFLFRKFKSLVRKKLVN
jgi:glycosyltransferase involved in cell wall biosynthesis